MHCACPQEGAALQCKPQVQLAKQLYVRFVFTHQPTALPHAQDFVKLAKWEDRGYYALRTSAGAAPAAQAAAPRGLRAGPAFGRRAGCRVSRHGPCGLGRTGAACGATCGGEAAQEKATRGGHGF